MGDVRTPLMRAMATAAEHYAKERPPDEHDQPLPVTNEHPIIQELVREDLEARLAVGIQRYGTGLQPHNGRDMLKDLYDELMDACVYVRGCLYERDGA